VTVLGFDDRGDSADDRLQAEYLLPEPFYTARMVEVSKPFKRWLINGIVLTIPLVVTLLVVLVVVDFVLGVLSPIVEASPTSGRTSPTTSLSSL
jgi:hypothetical protein